MLSPYPVIVDVVVRWADMDALGHVNSTAYFEYFETVRITYLERSDILSVGARVSALGDDRFLMECEARSQELGKTVADGDTLVVSYDYVAGRRVPLRADYRSAILALEERELPPVPRRGGRARSTE